MILLAQIATGLTVSVLAAAGGTVSPPEPFGGPALDVVGSLVIATDEEPDLPDTDVGSWLVADLDSGVVLGALNAHEALPPASTIKLLTALVTLPAVDPELSYVATDADARIRGSRVGLVPDETYSWEDLAHGLLLGSGNDAAHALAELAGGQQATIDLMNVEAARLGAVRTRAVTPHGLDEPGQVSTAYDLALIARAVLADETVAALVRTRTYEFPGLDGTTFQIQNQNRLLGRYDGTIGLKTGYTNESGHSLVAAAERDGVRLVATVLGADGRAEPVAEALLDWAFPIAGTAEPVGVLVTPEEVAAAQATAAAEPAYPAPGGADEPQEDQDERSDAAAAGDGGGSPLLGRDAPLWLLAVAGAFGVGLVGWLVRRWARQRSGGRYAL
jgi:serine-type D-Ala-D-Ala carboxypeptidase (penicillin-binding protein 5/6)